LRTTGPDVRAFMLAGKALSDAGMTYDEISDKVQSDDDEAQP